MKKIIIASLALISLVTLGSCKAKQSAYRKAYEQAKKREIAGQDNKPTLEYEAPATSTTEAQVPVSVRKERVTTYTGEDANHLKRFSVVIGSFQNPTNARNLKDRMVQEGYNAVLATNEAVCYVSSLLASMLVKKLLLAVTLSVLVLHPTLRMLGC